MRGFGASFLALAAVVAVAAPAEEHTLPELGAIPLEVPMLRFDPFSPPLLSLRGATGSEGSPSLRGAAWTPTLTGVVVAGPRSVANLNGVILGVGEEANGYRLLEVREGEAVFEREGREVVMSLHPKDAAAEENEE